MLLIGAPLSDVEEAQMPVMQVAAGVEWWCWLEGRWRQLSLTHPSSHFPIPACDSGP